MSLYLTTPIGLLSGKRTWSSTGEKTYHFISSVPQCDLPPRDRIRSYSDTTVVGAHASFEQPFYDVSAFRRSRKYL